MITILDSSRPGNHRCEAERGCRQEGGSGERREEGESENESIGAGDMEGKGRWVPRVWEQGGTQAELAVQVAPQRSPADVGDHLWKGDHGVVLL